jgi:hypothetical protein
MTKKRKWRPLKETVFFESLAYKIVYFPSRLVWSIIHFFDAVSLRLWRIKNVDIPYKKRSKKK